MSILSSTEVIAAVLGAVVGAVISLLGGAVFLFFTEKGQRLRAAATQEAQDARELRNAKRAVVEAMSDESHQLGTFLQMVCAYPQRIDELFRENEQKMNALRAVTQRANMSLGSLDLVARERLYEGPIRQLAEMDGCIDEMYEHGGVDRIALFGDTKWRYQTQMLDITKSYFDIANGTRECPRLNLPKVIQLHRTLRRPALKMILDRPFVAREAKDDSRG